MAAMFNAYHAGGEVSLTRRAFSFLNREASGCLNKYSCMVPRKYFKKKQKNLDSSHNVQQPRCHSSKPK